MVNMGRNAGALLLLVLLVGCAPGLDSELGVGQIIVPTLENPPLYDGSVVRVQIRPFVDNRPSSAIAIIGAREINSKGDLAVQVRDTFEFYLRDRGIETNDPQAAIIGGQIVQWIVRVDSGFPTSEAQAEATIILEVSNLTNQVVYQGKYSGSTTVKHPMLSESRISAVLAEAMGFAIEEALRDEKLIDRIVRTQRPIF